MIGQLLQRILFFMKVRVNENSLKFNLQNLIKIYEKRVKIFVENFVILIKSSMYRNKTLQKIPSDVYDHFIMRLYITDKIYIRNIHLKLCHRFILFHLKFSYLWVTALENSKFLTFWWSDHHIYMYRYRYI